jgi:nucleotide-binding universal stress UspA family protein
VKTVLAAVNDSEPARRALETAIAMAEQLHAKLVVLHVVDVSKV